MLFTSSSQICSLTVDFVNHNQLQLCFNIVSLFLARRISLCEVVVDISKISHSGHTM